MSYSMMKQHCRHLI